MTRRKQYPDECPVFRCVENGRDYVARPGIDIRLRAAEKAYDAVVSQLGAERAAHAATRETMHVLNMENVDLHDKVARVEQERDALRKEVAQLTQRVSDLEADEQGLIDRGDFLAKTHSDAHAETQAKLGRAVAALRAARPWIANLAGAPQSAIDHDSAIVDAILADCDSAAAGDSYASREKAIEAWCRWYSKRLDNGSDYTGYEQDLFEAFGCLGAVDARRGGDDDKSGPLRSVAELIAATENPPPVPPEIWRRGGK